MSKIKVQSPSSGTAVFTLTTASGTTTDRTITLPDSTGTVLMSDGDGSGLSNVGVDGIVSSADATAITIDSLERVGIGTTSPDTLVHIKASSGATLKVEETGGSYGELSAGGSGLHINAKTGGYITLRPNGGTEALRVTSDGRGLSQFTAKAWIHFNGTGTVAIRDSHNVSSISDGGTGYYTVNWTNNLANTNYSVSITNRERVCKPESIDLYTSSMFFSLRQDGGSYMDSEKVFTQVFGD